MGGYGRLPLSFQKLKRIKMAEALGKKKKVRGGYRAYVTTVIAEVNEILPNYQPEQQTDLRKFKITLKEQLDNLKN